MDEPTSREELYELLDRLTEALPARDARSLPLAADARFTENAQEVAPTEGIWAIATGLGPRLLEFVDPGTGQAGFMTVAEEHGERVGLTARLKAEGGRVKELELIVARGAPLFNPEGMAGPSPLLKIIEPAHRASRDELIAAANAYFDALVSGDGDSIPVTADCCRLENGTHTVLVQSTAFGSSLASQGLNLFKMGVAASAEIRGHGRIDFPPLFLKPHTNLVSEAFQIEDGRIRAIHAIFDYFPYGMKTGWS